MIFWETAHEQPGQTDLMLDFARVWQAADKVVYSTTLDTVSAARTRLERTFDPEAVRQLKARADRGYHRGLRQSGRPGHQGRPGGRVPPD